MAAVAMVVAVVMALAVVAARATAVSFDGVAWGAGKPNQLGVWRRGERQKGRPFQD